MTMLQCQQGNGASKGFAQICEGSIGAKSIFGAAGYRHQT